MKTRILSLALTLSLVFTLIPAVNPFAVAADTFTPVTGMDMLQNILLGLNFENTLDARPWDDSHRGLETETLWGAPKIKQWHFKSIAQKGFTCVRLPISWEPHMDKDYKIDKKWMDRVAQCVDWALDEGLYVIINTHHESGLYNFMNDDQYNSAKNELTAIWSQVAERFKNYSEKLIFEPMNEPRPGSDGWFGDYKADAAGIQRISNIANKLNADALETIRKSGGNNAKRVVMLAITQADPKLIEFYEHPDDPYTMLGIFVYENDEDMLACIKAAMDRGIPVVGKEATPLTSSESQKLLWARNIAVSLSEMGVPLIWWTYGDSANGTMLLDRHTGRWLNEPLLNAVFDVYGKTSGGDFYPPAASEDGIIYTMDEFVIETFVNNGFAHGLMDSGTPIGLKDGSGLKISGRQNDWDAVDITESLFEVGGEYEISVTLRTVSGKADFKLSMGSAPYSTLTEARNADQATLKYTYKDLGCNVRIQTSGSTVDFIIESIVIRGVGGDSPATWAEDSVAAAVVEGLIPPHLQSSYAQTITRAEYCALTVALYERLAGKAITERKSFPDDNGDANIQKLYGLGIVSGSSGRFNPSGEFSRAEVAAMTVKLLEKLGKPLAASDPIFADNPSIPAWALPAVGQVQAAGLMGGVGGNRFGPAVKYDRQSAMVLSKTLHEKYR